ncbi:MAG: hypothetical protein AAGG46_02890 [Planctomycetota bacterium]
MLAATVLAQAAFSQTTDLPDGQLLEPLASRESAFEDGNHRFPIDPFLVASPLADELLDQFEADGRLDTHEVDLWVSALAADSPRISSWAEAARCSIADAPPWLTDTGCPWSIANPLTLQAARDAALHSRYESAIEWLDLRAANATRGSGWRTSDGEALALFYRAIATHQLVRLGEAAEAAQRLLELSPNDTARRHRHAARWILRDAEASNDESLGYVAKLMGDSKRRLSLGESGERERRLQSEIVDRLDKLIEDLEEQQRQQQQSQQQAQGGSPSQGPKAMERSLPGDMKGQGDVADRKIGSGGDWGSLPPAERQRVTQEITRDFPGHYRALIEQYFRSLADPESESGEGREAPPDRRSPRPEGDDR